MWQVSQPMSRAAWRLPSFGVLVPSVWQLRQRFSSFGTPDVGFNSLLTVSDMCGSWHLAQSRTAGGWIVWPSTTVLFSWQLRHREVVVVLISFTRVTSLFTRTSWQDKQPIETAVCTWAPLVLASWHSIHCASLTSLSRGTGCLAARAELMNIATTASVEMGL